MKSPTLEEDMYLLPTGFLSSQLQLIEKHGYRNLVSNYSSTALYPKSSWMGRIWTWIYYFIGHQEEKLHYCIDKIFQAYRARLHSVEPHVDLYRSFMAGNQVDQERLRAARKELYDFYQMAGGLTLKPFYSVILIESHMKAPFPVQLLKRYSLGFELESEEEKELTLWVKHFQSLNIPIQWLHESLCHLEENPAHLEKKLSIEFKGELFATRDLEHLEWRDGLKPGDTVKFNNRKITLGKKLGENRAGDMQVHFEIEGDNEKVLYIGTNRALPAIRVEIARSMAWGIEPAKIHEVDWEGRGALIERLKTPITKGKWSVGDANTDKLIEWIQWLQKGPFLPLDFFPKFFMFDCTGQLRSTRPLVKTDYKHEEVEKFIDGSIQNAAVAHYIKNMISH